MRSSPRRTTIPERKRPHPLVELYGEFLEWKDPAKANRTNSLTDVAGQSTDVYPDYSARAVRVARMAELPSSRKARSEPRRSHARLSFGLISSAA